MERLTDNIPLTEAEREAKMGKTRKFLIKALQRARLKLHSSSIAELFKEDYSFNQADTSEALMQLDIIHEITRN